jgi:hypothetical protein
MTVGMPLQTEGDPSVRTNLASLLTQVIECPEVGPNSAGWLDILSEVLVRWLADSTSVLSGAAEGSSLGNAEVMFHVLALRLARVVDLTISTLCLAQLCAWAKLHHNLTGNNSPHVAAAAAAEVNCYSSVVSIDYSNVSSCDQTPLTRPYRGTR